MHYGVPAAMRSAGVKPNAATSAAFAAGLLTVTACCTPTHPLGGMSAQAGEWTETDDGQRRGDVAPMLHAAAGMCHQAPGGRGCGPVASRGPRSAEVLRAMLALNMRPDAATCVTLVRATAAAHDAGVSECLRLIEAMRGAGAVPAREWYLTAAAAARTVTQSLYIAKMSREHLQHGLVETLVCQQLLRSLCARGDFYGIAQVRVATSFGLACISVLL